MRISVILLVLVTCTSCQETKEKEPLLNLVSPIEEEYTLSDEVEYHEERNSIDFWFYNLDEAAKNPEKVINLSLRGKQYDEFPNVILKFHNLEKIDISFNPITGLPEEIYKLSKLKSLNLSSCKLNSLPESIGSLTELKTLNLLFNRIEEIPSNIGELENLEVLNLNGNLVKTLPKSIYKLNNLKRLAIGDWDQDKAILSDEEVIELKRQLPNCRIIY